MAIFAPRLGRAVISWLPNSSSPKPERLREIDGLLVWFDFFFFPKRKRERYNDVNVTVATSLRVSLREFARVREFERV